MLKALRSKVSDTQTSLRAWLHDTGHPNWRPIDCGAVLYRAFGTPAGWSAARESRRDAVEQVISDLKWGQWN